MLGYSAFRWDASTARDAEESPRREYVRLIFQSHLPAIGGLGTFPFRAGQESSLCAMSRRHHGCPESRNCPLPVPASAAVDAVIIPTHGTVVSVNADAMKTSAGACALCPFATNTALKETLQFLKIVVSISLIREKKAILTIPK